MALQEGTQAPEALRMRRTSRGNWPGGAVSAGPFAQGDSVRVLRAARCGLPHLGDRIVPEVPQVKPVKKDLYKEVTLTCFLAFSLDWHIGNG